MSKQSMRIGGRIGSRLMLIGAALGAGFLAGCGGEPPASPAVEERAVTAQVETVTPTLLKHQHSAPATLVAAERAEVSSRLMGHIRDIAVVEGQRVAAGQRLFSVDPIDIEGQIEQTRQSLRQAEHAARDARIDFERYERLYKEEVVPRQQLEKMQLQLDLANSRVEQARAGLGTAMGQLRYAAVPAPIAGVVTRKLAHTGDMAVPGQPVLVIENPARLQVETQVGEAIFRGLKLGQTVEVEVDGQAERIQARVARLAPAADPVSRTFMVRLDIATPGLMSGAFARVLFPLEAREGLRVPASALVRRAGIEGVFVVDSDGVAQFRMLRTGTREGGLVEVQAGLTAGERIVVEGAERLQTGNRIQG